MFLNQPRAAQVMDEAGLDALLATTRVNVFYLTGIWNKYENLVIIRRNALDQPAAALPLHAIDYGLEMFPAVQLRCHFGTFYREEPEGALSADERLLHGWAQDTPHDDSQFTSLCRLIEELGLTDAAVGHDEKDLEPHYVEQLQERFPRLRLVPSYQTFRQIRALKTPEEIERLTGAAHVTEQSIVYAANTAYEGMTEREMAIAFETQQIRLGAQPNLGHIGFGHGGMLGMINRGDDRLQRGDMIRFDAGCMYRGYASDLARTFAFGEADAKLRQYYGAILAGQQAAIECMKPGVLACEVFERGMAATREHGIPHYKRHHIGHGIGIGYAGYDIPLIGPKDRTPLAPGMVLEIETPYYEFGWGGIQVEDTVLVTEGGHEILTTISRELGMLDAAPARA